MTKTKKKPEWSNKTVKISNLSPAKYNPRRRLTEKEESDLGASLDQFGLADSIVINKDQTVIGGHQRIKILKSKGIESADVRFPDRQLTKDEEKRLNLRLNRNNGGFDLELLADMSRDMLEEVGFDSTELDKIFKLEHNKKDDDIPDVPHETSIVPGDVYQLGSHRIMCGDSTNADHVEKLMDENFPFLMVTDPPYGVEYDPKWRDGVDLGDGKRSKGKVQNDDTIDWGKVFCLFNPIVLYVWHAGKFTDIVAEGIRKSGYDIISQIIWVKHHFVISRGDYHWQHEPCWYAVKTNHKHNWQGARDQTTVWTIENNNSFGKKGKKDQTWGHGTQKPVECMERAIRNNSALGNIIVDPFIGSGTTLIACQKTHRICYGMEIDPIYCDVILKRWEAYTKDKAFKIDY